LPAAARLFINEYFFTEVAFPDDDDDDSPLIEYPVRELRVSLFSDCILFSKPLSHSISEARRETVSGHQNLPPVITLEVYQNFNRHKERMRMRKYERNRILKQ
jgi:hypothetical protein